MRPWRAPAQATALGLVLLMGLAACAGGTDGSGSPASAGSGAPSQVTVPGAGMALLWGDGPYGLVLLHGAAETASSWGGTAAALAADRMTVVALETVSADALRATIVWLQTTRSVPRVAVLAERDAAGSVAALGQSDSKLIDQAIVISPPAGLDWRAEFPKLFAASSGEAAAGAAREATDQAAGTWNVLLLVAGSDSGQAIFGGSAGGELLSAVLRRLDERR